MNLNIFFCLKPTTKVGSFDISYTVIRTSRNRRAYKTVNSEREKERNAHKCDVLHNNFTAAAASEILIDIVVRSPRMLSGVYIIERARMQIQFLRNRSDRAMKPVI
jgi:hypothetical protein